MDYLKRNSKRVLTDAAGYGLLIAALLTGWIPGPGGIPLAIAGLGLLSINNEWARRLRDYLLKNGGELVKALFPATKSIQWLYDIVVVLLWILVAVLAWRHAAAWQVGLAVGLFFMATAIALLNRDRYNKLRKPRA